MINQVILDVSSSFQEPASVNPETVIMQDDSMAPTFVKGDILTIDYEVF